MIQQDTYLSSHSSSWSIVVRAYTSEIQPNRTRAAATSVGQALNQLLNAVVVRTSDSVSSHLAQCS